MPRPDGAPCLPTDVPPRNVTRITHGLVTHASLGEVFVPLYTEPFEGGGIAPAPAAFPHVKPSSVAPNGLAPTWVVAVNGYSPIAHRNPLAAVIPPRPGASQGVARPTQRPRGYALPAVTRWPQLAPRWPSWGEVPGARRG